MSGWIKLHRKILDSSVFSNPHLLKMWIWCLTKATHAGYKQLVGLEKVELKPGQFITGRYKGSSELNVNPSTWYKHLKLLESMTMIELESNNKMTIVSVINWGLYQGNNLEKEQQNNNKITTKEQQNNTNKNVKKDKKVKNETYKDIVEYLNAKTNKNFKHTTKATQTKINTRLAEGFTLDDFIIVIDNKVSEWLNDANMQKYLRPETLFGTKFESYLNQGGAKNGGYRTNNRETKGETDRLREIAIKEGLIGEDGSVGEIGEVDF